MYGDVLNREYGKAKEKEYLDEAEVRRLVKAYKAARAEREPKLENLAPELATDKGGFLGLIRWLFQGRESIEVH